VDSCCDDGVLHYESGVDENVEEGGQQKGGCCDGDYGGQLHDDWEAVASFVEFGEDVAGEQCR